ncbi:MAG: hypothetical protein HY729_06940, partial [Candidatus Rokubacteria bacterium]|nr:hypothetical protein [Candidatus Rokubacteria bacterium]
MGRVIPLSDVGWKAAAALRASGGRTRVLAALSESIYLTAGDAIVWLGRAGATLHPRAMLTTAPLPAPAAALHLDAGGARPWASAPVVPAPSSAGALAAGCRALVARLSALGPPDGLGALLAGAAAPFPLDTAGPRARALARACAADDARAALEAATAL